MAKKKLAKHWCTICEDNFEVKEHKLHTKIPPTAKCRHCGIIFNIQKWLDYHLVWNHKSDGY